MNYYHPGHPRNRRSVAQRWILLPLCLLALATLLYTPLIGAGHPTGRNQAFAFHGHFANVASIGTARWFHSEEQNSQEQNVSILPQPVPIPGGINLPPVIHVFGPSDLDTEPTVITNFKGFSALAYPTGTNAARDNNGNFYDMSNDMRVFQGEYVAADGSHHRGTFVFI
jgi:hypothetical protein